MAHASTRSYSAPQASLPRRRTSPQIGRLGWFAVSVAAFVLVWAVAAWLVDSRKLPSPAAVAQTIGYEIANGRLLYHVGVTMGRVTVSFVLAMVVGSAIGIALGRSRNADRFFDSWLIFFLNLPALVVIILSYVWLGLTETAAVVAVAVNKIPNVAVQVREGTRALSRDLFEMASIYRFGRLKTLQHVTLPQLAPFFLASARSGLALVWKIVLVVEMLGRSNGVGYQLHIAFSNADVKTILAYAISFIIVVQAIELLILQPLANKVNRWRR